MELLYLRHSSRASNKQLAGGIFLLYKSKYVLTADKPKLLSIFGDIGVITKLPKVELNGNAKVVNSVQHMVCIFNS